MWWSASSKNLGLSRIDENTVKEAHEPGTIVKEMSQNVHRRLDNTTRGATIDEAIEKR